MKISMNLAESYLENWGTWEVAREFICNAKDAGEHSIETPDSGTLIIRTVAEPTFAQLMVVGASESRHNSEAIGQFGEGAKMATLVATRLGGSVEVRTSEGRLTFFFQDTEGIRDRVLYANTNRKYCTGGGCITTIKLPGIAGVIGGRFTDSETPYIAKDFASPAKIFSKGVFITELGQDSIYDWNIPLQLNRDRAVVSSYDVKNQIATIFSAGAIPVEAYEKLLRNKNSLEHDSMYHVFSWQPKEAGKASMQEAWKSCFGPMAVIASQHSQVNEIAFAKGYKVISCRNEISSFDIPTAESIVKTSDTFEEVVVPANILDECHAALDIMDIPATVAFFADNGENLLGKATWEDGVCIAWLNERLAKPGSRTLRLSTLAHELCHISSRSGDATSAFEYKLDEICGKLLAKLL